MNPDQEYGAQTHPEGPDHPKAEHLVGYADGQLPADRREQVRRHLESCAECRALVEDLAAYPELEGPGEDYEVSDEESRASLGSLRARILAEDLGLPALPKPAPAPRRIEPPAPGLLRFWRRAWRSQPLRRLAAAVFLFVLAGWGIRGELRVDELEGDLAAERLKLAEIGKQLLRPRANAGIVQLLSRINPLRSPAPRKSLGPSGLTVIVAPYGALVPGPYRAEVRDLSGTAVQRIDDLKAQPEGLVFYLPPGSLAPGEYSVHLEAPSGVELPGAWRLVLEH